MNKDIVFKFYNNNLKIIANDTLSYESFLHALKERLDKLYVKDDLLKSNVELDISNIELDSKKILQIFETLSNYNNIYLYKITYKKKLNKSILMHEGNIHSGETKLFKNNTLIIGNINKNARVIVNGDLYVIGKVNGNIELKSSKNRLICSSIDEAYIKICLAEKDLSSIRGNSIIECKNNSIFINQIIDGREKEYGKSNCCYIG